MITIEDTSSLKVIVNVEEADILKIQEGMPATVSTDATGDEEIKGTVTRVVRVKNQSTNTNGTDTNTSSGYSAEITIDNTELLVGMSAKAKIVIKDRGTQLAVPYDLIRQDDNGDSYVLVAEANQCRHLRTAQPWNLSTVQIIQKTNTAENLRKQPMQESLQEMDWKLR